MDDRMTQKTSDNDRASQSGPKMASLGGDATLTLIREDNGPLYIQRFDVIMENGRMRLSFDQDMPIADVLRAEVAEAIGYLVARITDTSLLSAPDFEVDAGGCRVHGATILTNIVKDNATAITIRLREISGNAMSLLHQSVVPQAVDSGALQRTIEDALNRIYVPLRNFDAALETAIEEHRDGDAERLHAQILAFRSEIDTVCYNFEQLLSHDISRLVDNSEEPRSKVPRARLRIVPKDE